MTPGTAPESVAQSGVKGKVFCTPDDPEDCGKITDNMRMVPDCGMPNFNADSCPSYYVNATMAGTMYYVPCKMDTTYTKSCIPNYGCALATTPGPTPEPALMPTYENREEGDIFFLACWKYDAQEMSSSKCPEKDLYQIQGSPNQITNDMCGRWADNGF